MHVQRYRKKPVVVEAIQYDGENVPQIVEWMALAESEITFQLQYNALAIETLEGIMCAGVGDWIIKGVKGEFYPCKPDIFDATYEPEEVSNAAPR